MDLDEFLAAEAAVAACERAQSRAGVLHAELSAEQATCQQLRDRLGDVRRSDRRSIGSWLDRLRGRRPDTTTPPSPEVAAVTAELSTHERAMQRLSADFAAARDEAAGLDDAQRRLTAAVEAREREIASRGDERASRLGELDGALAGERAARDELRAAHHAALGALGALDRAIEALSHAGSWSSFDTASNFAGSGGATSHSDWIAGRAKHEALDRSVVPVAEAHAALLRLRAGLTDVSSSTVHDPNIRTPSSGLSTLDVWFDNRFSDLMVHDRITSSLSELERARSDVRELIDEVRPREEAVDERVTALELRRDELLRGR